MQLVGGPRCGQEIDDEYYGATFICEQPIINDYNHISGELGEIRRIRYYYSLEGGVYVYKGVM